MVESVMGSVCGMIFADKPCCLPFAHLGPHEWGDATEHFKGGAVRRATVAGSDRPADYSQHSMAGMRRLAEAQAEGNIKYGYGNWQKGIPVSNMLSHALAHLFALINGDASEDHLGHALWNLDKAAHFIETRPDLIDILPMRKAMKLDEEVK